jgi:hypothetical protein
MNQVEKNRVKKIIANYCKNPDHQIQNIIKCKHLEHLEIYWHELAKR